MQSEQKQVKKLVDSVSECGNLVYTLGLDVLPQRVPLSFPGVSRRAGGPTPFSGEEYRDRRRVLFLLKSQIDFHRSRKMDVRHFSNVLDSAIRNSTRPQEKWGFEDVKPVSENVSDVLAFEHRKRGNALHLSVLLSSLLHGVIAPDKIKAVGVSLSTLIGKMHKRDEAVSRFVTHVEEQTLHSQNFPAFLRACLAEAHVDADKIDSIISALPKR